VNTKGCVLCVCVVCLCHVCVIVCVSYVCECVCHMCIEMRERMCMHISIVCIHTHILNHVHVLRHILERRDCEGLCVMCACVVCVCHACMRVCVMGVS